MTFAQLRALDAVARTGSVGRAAEELEITQPAVSHALRALERRLGAKLLARRRDGGVALTAAGQAVARRAAVILAQVEGLQQEIAAAAGHQIGTLRVGAFPSAVARLLPPILQSFRTAYPAVSLVLLEGSDEEVLDWLRTGAVDVGTVTAAADGIDATRLTSDSMLAILPRGHALASWDTVTLAQLGREPFIVPSGGCEPLIKAMAERANVQLRRHYDVRDTSSIVAMVREGLGVTIMPELALPVDADVRAVPFDPPERRQLMLALPAGAPSLPIAKAFLEHAVEAVRGTADDTDRPSPATSTSPAAIELSQYRHGARPPRPSRDAG